MALQAAGSSLLQSAFKGSTLGVRALREEYEKPIARADIPRNLRLVEERVDSHTQGQAIASAERLELPRFKHLFKENELLPSGVFIAALELNGYETLNGRRYPYDPEVLVLRDVLVASYKPLVAKIRQLLSKEIDDLPTKAVVNFTRAWTAWEGAWLRSREVHAVEALQPLAKAILSLEPLLLSHEKEKLLPYPRVQHQKVVTLKCLEGFVASFAELAGSVLPSLQRELDHDPRLLLLMDHVLKQRDASVDSCLQGLSATPEVAYPDHQKSAKGASMAGQDAKGLTLDAYAFKLMGLSTGDSAARLRASSTGRLPKANSSFGSQSLAPLSKESNLSRLAAGHATELLSSFEAVKELLLSLKSTLEYIDPGLDRDEQFLGTLQRFERAFKRSKRLFLEPDNLA